MAPHRTSAQIAGLFFDRATADSNRSVFKGWLSVKQLKWLTSVTGREQDGLDNTGEYELNGEIAGSWTLRRAPNGAGIITYMPYKD